MERSLRCCLPPPVLREREVQGADAGYHRRDIIGNFKTGLRRKGGDDAVDAILTKDVQRGLNSRPLSDSLASGGMLALMLPNRAGPVPPALDKGVAREQGTKGCSSGSRHDIQRSSSGIQRRHPPVHEGHSTEVSAGVAPVAARWRPQSGR